MPNIKANVKHLRQSIRRKVRNKAIRTNVKTVVKKALEATTTGAPEASQLVGEAVRMIDKAESKGVLHKNTAARKKSQLMASLKAGNSAGQAPAA